MNIISGNRTSIASMQTRQPPIRLHEPSSTVQKVPHIQRLNQLSRQALIPQKVLKKHFGAASLNSSYQWNTAQMQALLYAIFTENSVTERDLPKLKEFENNFTQLKLELNLIKKTQQLSEREYEQAALCIDEARDLVGETRLLIQKLEGYNSEAVKLDAAREVLVTLCYSPGEGNPMLAMDALKDAMQSLTLLKGTIVDLHGNPKSVAYTKLVSLFKQDITQLNWVLEDWADAIDKQAAKELRDLSKAAESSQQYEALLRHFAEMQAELKSLIKTLEQMPDLKEFGDLFREGTASLNTAKTVLKSRSKKATSSLKKLKHDAVTKPMKYGDKDWDALAQKFPSKKQPSWIAAKIKNITEPENWSPQTKDFVYRTFAALQLGQQVQEGTEHLKRQVEILREQALRNVPEDAVKLIDREAGIISRALTDFYQEVIDNPDAYEYYPGKNPDIRRAVPEIRSTVKEAIEKYGKQGPTNEQVIGIMESHRTSRMLQVMKEGNVKTPLKTLSISEWWSKFTSSSEKAEQPESPFSKEHSNALTPKTLSADIQDSLAPNPMSYPIEAQQAFASLNTAVDTLSSTQKTLIKNDSPMLTSLREEAALLQRELLRTLSMTPKENSMQRVAHWIQRAEDQCYALEMLEKRIATAMKAAKGEMASLWADDAELQKYGKKHENLIKQARLANALQLPGINVPVPQGIASDQVYAFLKKEAPEVFDHWTALKDEYAAYKGTEPFMQQPQVQKHLEAIDSAIARAFSDAEMDLPKEMQEWLEAVDAAGEYLMIRSTGAEDSRATANAGGNVSAAYIPPKGKALLKL